MLENIKINQRVLEKLKTKHKVLPDEISECFINRSRGLLEDTRLNHKTEPPTFWFIAETDFGRLLKIVFIEIEGAYEIKTAYEPNKLEVRIYEKYA